MWHLCVGHPSFSRFKFLAEQLHLNNASYSHNCSICPLAKQTRLSFPRSSITTHSAFDLLHCDVWGPHKVPTHYGLRVFLTIVDDFTRCTWVFRIQHKSKVHHFLMNFVKFVQTQFHTTIKIVRLDNVTEFLSLQPFFTSCDIEFQHPCVYIPQQNGAVERKHRHMLNVSKSPLFRSQVPLNFLEECILTAVYLINRTPSPLLSNKTPFKALYKRPPTFHHLKVFGCKCYATVVQPKQKFEPRAIPCVFVGYPCGKKSYKLYDMQSKKKIISRDVKFCEDDFPFSSASQTLTLAHSTPILPLHDSSYTNIHSIPPPTFYSFTYYFVVYSIFYSLSRFTH